jgi:hypothetical protein
MQPETQIENAEPLIYAVGFGGLFKMTHEGKRVTAISIREKDKGFWHDAQEIEDYPDVYKDLADDQFAIVHVESLNDVLRVREIFTAVLLGDGDTATIQQAVHQKKLGQIMEKAFLSWLKKSGPILLDSDGSPTYINPVDLVARYSVKDMAVVRRAYETQLKEGEPPERMPILEKSLERFNAFLDRFKPEDELYWFEHSAPLADRIGYCILRKGRVVSAHLVLMS